MSENLVTLGNPVLYFKTLPSVKWNAHHPQDITHVSFSLVRQPNGPINLLMGEGPRFYLAASEMKLDLTYDPTENGEDLTHMIDRLVIDKVLAIISAANVKVGLGQKHSLDGHYHVEVTHDPGLKGLWVDPKAVAHKNWFE